MNPSSDTTSSEQASRANSRLRVIGVGGGGCRMIRHLAAMGLDGASFCALSTDLESVQACAGGIVVPFQLGARLTRGLGAGGDPEIGRIAAEESAEGVGALCSGAELVILLAGLGGGTGSGAAPVVAEIARRTGALVVGMVTLPFACEGQRRRRQAEAGLQRLKAVADVVLCLPNERVLSLIDPSTSLVETFRFSEVLLGQGVRGICRLAGGPGLINVDLADLREALRDKHAESFFACAEAVGEQRVRDVIDQLLLSPLLENGALLRDAGNVLVSLVAGPDLSMAELNRVTEQLRRECEGADVLLGAQVDPALGERLCLTLVATRREHREPLATTVPALEASVRPVPGPLEEPSLETDFFRRQPPPRRPRSRFIPPPPELTPEQRQEALTKASQRRARPQQTLLPLAIVSKGRFEKSEPTLHRGEDLDIPTFIRRGLVLN